VLLTTAHVAPEQSQLLRAQTPRTSAPVLASTSGKRQLESNSCKKTTLSYPFNIQAEAKQNHEPTKLTPPNLPHYLHRKTNKPRSATRHFEPSPKHINGGGFGFQNRLLVHNIIWLGQPSMESPTITKNSNNGIFLKTITFHRHV
jgi:hypothetical protein